MFFKSDTHRLGESKIFRKLNGNPTVLNANRADEFTTVGQLNVSLGDQVGVEWQYIAGGERDEILDPHLLYFPLRHYGHGNFVKRGTPLRLVLKQFGATGC